MKIARDLVVAFLYFVVLSAVVVVLLPQGRWVASGGLLCFGLGTLCLMVWRENKGHEFFFEPGLRRRPLLGSLIFVVAVTVAFFAVINATVVGYETVVGQPYPGCSEFTVGFWNYF